MNVLVQILNFFFSITEENIWITLLNIGIVVFAVLGLVILVKSYIDFKSERKKERPKG